MDDCIKGRRLQVFYDYDRVEVLNIIDRSGIELPDYIAGYQP